jgi:CRISPR-associated protein Cas5t
MIGLYVTVPIACFRRGLAREYLETEPLPPPATCYGFLLSLVGETDRHRHLGCRVTAGLVGRTSTSVVLRTVWRVKDKGSPQGSGTNARPDFQQLLTGDSELHPFIQLVMWLDSSEDIAPGDKLERRVQLALDPGRRSEIDRFGGLSLGESSHMVDSICLLDEKTRRQLAAQRLRVFELHREGTLTLPVWVDHVGSRGTRYATGNLMEQTWDDAPPIERIPAIRID